MRHVATITVEEVAEKGDLFGTSAVQRAAGKYGFCFIVKNFNSGDYEVYKL